ncbi:MAG TPA: S8 family serine peptidase [Candidatus Polarisedimenticolaceae bacterium]|nr:S8 family serine peptidase [Candidatus Polarisedimenticolaceae bacterium]
MRASRIRFLLRLSFAVATSAAVAAPGELRLRFAGGEFRPAAPQTPPAWFSTDRSAPAPRGERCLVAIAERALEPAERHRLEATGARLLGYLPDNGYRLCVSPGAESAIRSLPFVAWLGAAPPHLEIAAPLAAAAADPAGDVRLRAILAPGEMPGRALGILAGLAPTAAPAGPDLAWRVSATVPAARLRVVLSALAALPEVVAVEPVRRVVPLNQDGVWVHQSFVGPAAQQTPIFDRGIFGCGQVISVADTAQDYDSCQFRDPAGPPPVLGCATPPCPAGTPDLSLRKDILYYNWSSTATGEEDTCPTLFLGGSGHGTHTSGSAAGDNAPWADCTTFVSPNRNAGDGQAPGARLVVIELGDGLEYLNELGGSIWNIADVAFQSGARIHSFSFGGVCYDALGQCVPGCELPYDSLARDADLAMWTYPDLLLVNAAGNSGTLCLPPDSVVTPAIAKNVLAVGGLEHGASANAVMPESSRGPVFDGRLRPTVAAQGRAVVSAASDADLGTLDCSTCSLDGTSMSAPTVAGLAALVREYYAAGFHVSGVRDAGAGISPSGALLKATLIGAAVDIAGAGPDHDSGFGRVQLDTVLPFDGASFRLLVDDHRQGLTTGSLVQHAIDVTAGETLAATLVWTDYPAEPNAATARVNELHLEVVDPTGNVWFQTLDPLDGTPAATDDPTDEADELNTEEQLVFASPAAGRWVVRVSGVSVPWGPQPYALVVRGAFDECAAPPAPAVPALATPADGQVQLSWAPVDGAASYAVERALAACPDGPWVRLATGVAATTYLDVDVSGGATYSYRVIAASDAAGACESPPSSCAEVQPTGDCTLTPVFAGVASAVSQGGATCGVVLDWSDGAAICPGDVVYNVYRDTSPDFEPAPANLIASCLSGTGYTDRSGLAYGTEYQYVVRAEDAAPGHGGPCRDGNQDLNLARAAAAPDGPATIGQWSDDAGDTGAAQFNRGPSWGIDETGGDSGPRAYRASSSQLVCTDLTSPPLTLAEPAAGPELSFSTKHALDYDPGVILFYEGSIGQVEIASGPAYSNWTRVPLAPDYPAYIDAPFYNVCPTTQAVGQYFSDIDTTWDTYTASLVNWGGQDVRIRFHLSGDLYFSGGDWWIDDVLVTQAAVPGSCATGGAAPPPVPDGATVSGAPMRAVRAGDDVVLSWDAAQCPAAAVNVYRGSIGDFTTFTGGDCDLQATGTATLAIPDDSWFLVVATDGADTDGSWSRDHTGAELGYSGAGTVCLSIVAHAADGVCPD